MVIDRIWATSARIPWRVPVFSGLCKGTVMCEREVPDVGA